MPNEPCNCGSGRKYKKCCMGKSESSRHRPTQPSPETLARIRKEFELKQKKEEMRRAQFGDIRPIIHANHLGYRFVAVGDQLRFSKNWRTVPDFLQDYLKFVFGKDFWFSELSKPYEERHQILQWAEDLHRAQLHQVKNSEGLYPVFPSGPTVCYHLLAYDLFVLAHHSALQNRIVKRMKFRDQFQGARYELMVTATCIRAGFDIDFEDETDGTIKHPEFVARCRYSGEEIAVEAKSRKRPGVMGEPGVRREDQVVRLRVGQLINNALEKVTDMPYIVFVDVNMPGSDGEISDSKTFQQLTKSFGQVGDEEKSDKFNAIVFTNFPHHYGVWNVPAPKGEYFLLVGRNPSNPTSSPEILKRLYDATAQFGRLPSAFEQGE